MLSDKRVSQLDNIVDQMVQNKETDEDIQFVVDDFKSIYKEAPETIKAKRFEESSLGKALGTAEQVTGFLPRLLGIAPPAQSSVNRAEERITRRKEEAGMGFGEKALRIGKEAGMEGIRTGAAAAPLVLGGLGSGLGAIPRIAAQTGIVSASKGIEELAKGKDPQEALLRAGTTGLLNTIMMGSAPLIGKGVKAFASTRAVKGMSETAEEIIKTKLPQMLKKPTEKMTDIARSAMQAIKSQKNVIGEAVGEAKDRAILEGKLVSRTPIIKEITSLLRKRQAFPKGGDLPMALERRPVLDKVLGHVRKIKAKADPKNLLDTLKNIDDSLTNTYTRRDKGKVLAEAEKIALKIRTKVNDEGIKVLEQTLSPAKKAFSQYIRILNDEFGEIARALNTNKGMESLLKAAVKEGRATTLKNLKSLDDLLPPTDKFFDNTLKKVVHWAVKNPKEFGISRNALLDKMLSGLTSVSGAALRGAEKPGTQAASRLARTAALRTTDLF